jgi:hypothetical protein
MMLVMRNVDKMDASEKKNIQEQAKLRRRQFAIE